MCIENSQPNFGPGSVFLSHVPPSHCAHGHVGGMGNSKTKKRAVETMTKLGKQLVLASKMMYCHYYSDLSIKVAF
jgi:hypothetical protein